MASERKAGATVDDIKAALDKAEWPPLDDRHAASLLHQLKHRQGRVQHAAARELLGCIAVHIHKGWPAPVSVAEWLRDAFIRAAYLDEAPAVALSLAAGRGRQENENTVLVRAAYLHVLWYWGLKQEHAAEVVGAFFHVNGTAGLIKAYNRKAKAWRIQGPFLADRPPERIDDPYATAADFLGGRDDVWVTFRSPATLPEVNVRILEDFREHVAKSGVFNDMDGHRR